MTARLIITRDLRDMLHDGRLGTDGQEAQVDAAAHATVEALLRRGVDVVCDDTNLVDEHIRALRQVAVRAGADVEVWDLSDVPVEVCVARDHQRGLAGGAHIGEQVIHAMHDAHRRRTAPGLRHHRHHEDPMNTASEGADTMPAEPIPPDLDAIRTALDTYHAIMRESDVPCRQADAAAHRLAAHLPALLTEVARLRTQVTQQADAASDYQLVSDEIAGKLIGDGWDDDATEVAIVIAWAQHMTRVHPDCPGRFCNAGTAGVGDG